MVNLTPEQIEKVHTAIVVNSNSILHGSVGEHDFRDGVLYGFEFAIIAAKSPDLCFEEVLTNAGMGVDSILKDDLLCTREKLLGMVAGAVALIGLISPNIEGVQDV